MIQNTSPLLKLWCLPEFLPYLPIWNTLWQAFYSFESHTWYSHHLHLTYPLNLLPTAQFWFFFLKCCIYKSGLSYSSSTCMSLTECHCDLLTGWPDRVTLPWERRETASSLAQQSLWERQSNLLDTATPSSPFFTAWSATSKMGKKKGFCSYSPPFPSSHSSYDIYLEMQGRRDTLPFLSVTGATGIHNLLYKPEGSRRYQCFVLALRWGLCVAQKTAR